jgi:ketosteroid isomerase-like protein
MKSLQLLITLLLSFYARSQTPVTEVMKLMKEQEQAWNRGDIPGFMEHYWKNDSLKFIGSSGITYGWKNTIERYQKAYPGKEAMGELKFTIIEATQLAKDAVYVIGKWELKKEKPAGGHFTLLWRRIDRKWVIVSDHTS